MSMVVKATRTNEIELRGGGNFNRARNTVEYALADDPSGRFRVTLSGPQTRHTKDLEKWLLRMPIRNLEVVRGKVNVISFETYDGDSRHRWVAEPADDGSQGGRWIVDSMKPIPDGTTWQDSTGRTWTAHGNLTLGEDISDEWIPGPGPEDT